jgi:hypothetical protein
LQVTGVQAVGGRGYVALAPVVVETRALPTSTAQEAGPAAALAARLADAESVVFPRHGANVDHRPSDLKQARAAAKYREHARVEPISRRRRHHQEHEPA